MAAQRAARPRRARGVFYHLAIYLLALGASECIIASGKHAYGGIIANHTRAPSGVKSVAEGRIRNRKRAWRLSSRKINAAIKALAAYHQIAYRAPCAHEMTGGIAAIKQSAHARSEMRTPVRYQSGKTKNVVT